MVAYSFMDMFVDDIVARQKRQTIRAYRKRHAHVGERVQLYTGMRTKHCRKIITDPVCIRLDEVMIDLRPLPDALSSIRPRHFDDVVLSINGIPIHGKAREVYAESDGFGGGFTNMALFWIRNHGHILFEGVAIVWEDRQ